LALTPPRVGKSSKINEKKVFKKKRRDGGHGTDKEKKGLVGEELKGGNWLVRRVSRTP